METTTRTGTPLRQRMIEDMRMCKLAERWATRADCLPTKSSKRAAIEVNAPRHRRSRSPG